MKKKNLARVLAMTVAAGALSLGTAMPAMAITGCTVASTICLFEDELFKQNKITAGPQNTTFGSYNNWASSVKNNTVTIRFYDGTGYTGQNMTVSAGASVVNLSTLAAGNWNDRIKSSVKA